MSESVSRNRHAPGEPPKRSVALVLSLCTGIGVGHFYLGLRRRAYVWLLGVCGIFVALTALFSTLGHLLGFRAALLVFGLFVLFVWIGPFLDVLRVRDDRFVRTPPLQVFGFWLLMMVITVASRVVVRVGILGAYRVPSGSMAPAIVPGDHLFGDKLAYRFRSPLRGEVVVVRSPEEPHAEFVKRVVALAGDRLEVKQGRLHINGWEVPHCAIGKVVLPDLGSDGARMKGALELEFLEGHAYLAFYDELANANALDGSFNVKPGEFFVMGDNRNNSADSRTWTHRGNALFADQIQARAVAIGFARRGMGFDLERTGLSLDAPHASRELEGVAEPFERCLRAQPPFEKTVPPKP